MTNSNDAGDVLPARQVIRKVWANPFSGWRADSGLEKMTTDQIIKRHPFIDAFSAATYLLLGGGGYKSMRDLVKSAKRDRRGKWKENAQYDHRSGKWFDKTTGAMVQPGGQIVVDGLDYDH